MINEMIKTNALVVRSANCGDNDRILTAVSPELGKISISAKGVKSLKNKNSAAAGILCYSSFVLKEGREIYSLSSAECIESFYHIRDSVESVAYGAYFAALLESVCQEGVPASEELRLTLNTLYALLNRSGDRTVLKPVYELRLSELLGIAPYISEECHCGGEAKYFDISEGETCCPLHKSEGAVPVSKTELEVMEYILTSELKEALFFTSPKEIVSRLWNISEKYLRFHLGGLPKQLDYLKSVIK